jgi:hypothetical protein
MSVTLEAETTATQFPAEQQHGRASNYQQRDQLLPIHAVKITPK